MSKRAIPDRIGSGPPYGYRYDADGRLVIDEQDAAVIEAIYRQRASDEAEKEQEQ